MVVVVERREDAGWQTFVPSHFVFLLERDVSYPQLPQNRFTGLLFATVASPRSIFPPPLRVCRLRGISARGCRVDVLCFVGHGNFFSGGGVVGLDVGFEV